MTFGNMNGFLIDFVGPAGDLMNGMTDNFHDPCSQRVTVGVGERVPVVVRASSGVVVRSGQPVGNQVNAQNTVQITAQNVSVGISQPGGASNPIRQEQPQSVTQPQTIAVTEAINETLQEFSQNGQSVGVTLLIPKVITDAKSASNVVKTLGQQIAVEVDATRQAAQLLSQSDEILYNQLANQLRNNQQNLQSILQKSGFGFDEVNAVKNAMFGKDNTLLQQILQKNSEKVAALTKNLQTAASNIAVRACG